MDTAASGRATLVAATLAWAAGLLTAGTCLGLPMLIGLLGALGAGTLATQHSILIPIFEMLLVASAAGAIVLARRVGRTRALWWIAAAMLLAGVGIFFHAAPVLAGMILLALVTARLAALARAAGVC